MAIMYLVSLLLSMSSLFSLSLQLQTKDEVKCECMKPQKCKYWIAAVNIGEYLDLPVCGYDRLSLAALLCCPSGDSNWISKSTRSKRDVQSLQGLNNIQLSCTITSHNSSPAQTANQKCAEYAKAVFQSVYEVSDGNSPFRPEKVDTCGRNNDSYFGAGPREFPHMALVGFGDEEISWLCGGSLISERYVLSAGHCAFARQHGPAKWVKLGELDLSTDTDIAKPQIYKITDRIVHPDYKATLSYNDISLFKLNKDVTINLYVRPACLFTKRDPPDDTADATGWGRTSFAGESSEILKKIKIDLLSMSECEKVYDKSSDRKIPQGLNADTMICALETMTGGQSVCQGDSGGPLQIPLKEPYCMYGLIGLTSFGKGCGFGTPGIFTRVTHFVPWIVENVWPE